VARSSRKKESQRNRFGLFLEKRRELSCGFNAQWFTRRG
jgi:hypothetical protein